MLWGSSRPRRLLAATLAILASLPLANPYLASGEGGPKPPPTDPPIRADYHEQTGKLTFLGASPQSPVVIQGALAAGLAPEGRARAAVEVYGPSFGLRNPSGELQQLGIPTSERGRTSVRYQQVHHGVPVVGGEIVVNQDSMGRLLSMSGEISPDLSLSVDPGVTPGDARDIAIAVTAKAHELDPAELVVSDPELWVYDARLLVPSSRPASLAWRVDVQGIGRLDIRELVLVDAQLGGVLLHFNQVDSALDRTIYDNENNSAFSLPGNGPIRTEGGAVTGNTEVDFAYDYSGDTYDFFLTEHGRDSLDDAGMPLISTVRYCPSAFDCPYFNASWNGTQMVYGDGFASADDVVGHELTHGVTEFTSHLFYYYQSGAINESLSDVWGEFVDQTNGSGTDTAGVRWLMGEDAPGGALRSMSDPPAFFSPDRIGSLNYVCDESDNGGVHSNSGVNNKAAYLMTDGGSFNGYSVTALGISTVADLYYEAQANLLTSGSNYRDLYNALIQASFDLGLGPSSRQEVQDALDAVQMSQRPCGASAEAQICPAGLSINDRFFDDMENTSSGSWTSAAIVGVNEWYYPQTSNPYGFDATYASSGGFNLWGYDQPSTADITMTMTSDVLLPADAFMHFKHDWAFEDSLTAWDGGVVEYTINGGASWNDAGPLFIENGYNDTISTDDTNPLGGRDAFAHVNGGYTASRLDLGGLSGQNVRFRFRIGTDSVGGDLGWFIDDVRVYTCDLIPTDTPSPTPSATPEPTATATPSPTPSATPEPTATDTPSPTPSATPLPTATDTPSPTPSATPLPTATDTPTPTPTETPLPTATDTPTPTPSDTPLPTATDAPSPTPSATLQPTATETPEPSATPTPTSTDTPVPSSTPGATPQPGDLNLDGSINVLDIQLCVNVFLALETDPGIVGRADVNGDDSVDVLDVQLLVNLFLAS